MKTKVYISTTLRQLEEELLTKEVRTCTNELQKRLAPDFFEFGSSGKVWYSGGNAGEEFGEVNMSIHDFQVTPLSDGVMLATYRTINHDTNQEALRSSVWKYMAGGWRMVFHQGTKTA